MKQRKRPHRTRANGTPKQRPAAPFLPNVAGCRYAIGGLLDRKTGDLIAPWSELLQDCLSP